MDAPKCSPADEKPAPRTNVAHVAVAVAFVIVVLIAPAVLLPYCLDFKSRDTQDAAKHALRALRRAEEAYRGRTGCYTADLSELGDIGPVPPGYEREIVAVDGTGYIARTWGNLDGDGALDIWEITDKSPEPICVSDDRTERGPAVDPRALPEGAPVQ